MGDLPVGVMLHFIGAATTLCRICTMVLDEVEPFTSLHVQLQDGKFDKPDRLFRSMGDAWDSCISNPSDVKELVPELFYLPEVLINNNHVDLAPHSLAREWMTSSYHHGRKMRMISFFSTGWPLSRTTSVKIFIIGLIWCLVASNAHPTLVVVAKEQSMRVTCSSTSHILMQSTSTSCD